MRVTSPYHNEYRLYKNTRGPRVIKDNHKIFYVFPLITFIIEVDIKTHDLHFYSYNESYDNLIDVTSDNIKELASEQYLENGFVHWLYINDRSDFVKRFAYDDIELYKHLRTMFKCFMCEHDDEFSVLSKNINNDIFHKNVSKDERKLYSDVMAQFHNDTIAFLRSMAIDLELLNALAIVDNTKETLKHYQLFAQETNIEIKPRRQFALSFPIIAKSLNLYKSDALIQKIDALEPLNALYCDINNTRFTLSKEQKKYLYQKNITKSFEIRVFLECVKSVPVNKLPVFKYEEGDEFIAFSFVMNYVVSFYYLIFDRAFNGASDYTIYTEDDFSDLTPIYQNLFKHHNINDLYLYVLKYLEEDREDVDFEYSENMDVLKDCKDMIKAFNNKVLVPLIYYYSGRYVKESYKIDSLHPSILFDMIEHSGKSAFLTILELSDKYHNYIGKYEDAGNDFDSVHEYYKTRALKNHNHHYEETEADYQKALLAHSDDVVRNHIGLTSTPEWLSFFGNSVQADNGCYVIPLLSSKELRDEGRAMHHCVGGGSYAENCRNGIRKIISVRDKNFNRLSTCEIDVSEKNYEIVSIVQHRAKNNEKPCDEACDVLDSFIDFVRSEQGFMKTELIELEHVYRKLREGNPVIDNAHYNPCSIEAIDAALKPWKSDLPAALRTVEGLFNNPTVNSIAHNKIIV